MPGRYPRSELLPHRPPARRVVPTRSIAASRKCCGGSATTSTSSSTRQSPSTWRRSSSAAKARWRSWWQRASSWCRCRQQGGADDRVSSAARRARRHAVDSPAQAIGGRSDGEVHPRPPRRKVQHSTPAAEHPSPTPARCSASRWPTIARAPAAAARGAQAQVAAAGIACHCRRWLTAAEQARIEPARGGARAVDGDEGRRQVAVVRRGHRGRAEKLRDYIERFLAVVPATAPSPASTRTRRLAACTCGRSST